MQVEVVTVDTEGKLVIPDSDTIVFPCRFSHPIALGIIPGTVTRIDLHNALNKELAPGVIPSSVTHLFLYILTKDMAIPESVTDLFVKDFKKDMIEHVPATVVNLYIHGCNSEYAPPDRTHYLFRFYDAEINESMIEGDKYVFEKQHTIEPFSGELRVMKRVPKGLVQLPSSQVIGVGPTYTDITFDTDTETIEFPDSLEGSIRPGSLDCYSKLSTIFWGKNMRDPIEPGVIPDRPIVLLMPIGYRHQITDNVPMCVAVAIYADDIKFANPINLPTRPIFFSWTLAVCPLSPAFMFYFSPGYVPGFRDDDRKHLSAIAVYRAPDGYFSGKGAISKFSDYWAQPAEPTVSTYTICTKHEDKEDVSTVPAESEATPSSLDPVPVLTSACVKKAQAAHLASIMPSMLKDGLELACTIKADVERAIKTGMLDDYRYVHNHKPTSSKPYGRADFADVMAKYLPDMRITTSASGYIYFQI